MLEAGAKDVDGDSNDLVSDLVSKGMRTKDMFYVELLAQLTVTL